MAFCNSTDSRAGFVRWQIVVKNVQKRYNSSMKKENFVATDAESTRAIIAQNLIYFRKASGYTQQQLAEILNYSDKAVSKWERAEGVPDVLVLKSLADLYGVSVNDFLIEHKKPTAASLFKSTFVRRLLVALLSAGLPYLIAAIVTAVGLMIDSTIPFAKYAFLVALSVSLIVLLVFSCMWCKFWVRGLAVSALSWSLCVLADVAIINAKSWLVYVVGASFQILVVLWFCLRAVRQKERRLHAESEQLGILEE